MSKKTIKAKDMISSILLTLKICFKIAPGLMIISTILRLVPSFSTIFAAFIGGQIITKLPEAVISKDPAPIISLMLIFLSIICVSWTVGTLGNYLRAKAQNIIKDESSRVLYAKYLKLSLQEKENKEIADKFKLASEFSNNLGASVFYLITMMTGIISVIVSFIAISSVNLWLGAVILLASLPIILIESRAMNRRRKFYRENATNIRLSRSIENAMIDQTSTIESTIFGLNKFLLEEWSARRRDFRDGVLKINRKFLPQETGSTVLSKTAAMGVKILVVYQIIFDGLPIGMYVTMDRLIDQLQGNTESFLSSLTSAGDSIAKSEDYFYFINRAEKQTVSQKLTSVVPEIEFKNVSFKYPDSKKFVLENFNLKIESGKSIALVGENGAGKTTIIKLLLGVFEPTKGQILVDGINLKKLNLDDYYSKIGALMQDFNRYKFATFGENIHFGDINRDVNTKDLREVLKSADGLSVLKKMPHGFDEIMSKGFDDENGTNLSGGEWQRLALARGFWRDPKILILDEPTAAVDAKAEYEIFSQIQDNPEVRTTIIISHRFSTVRKADEILVLENGKIIESGIHERLMKSGGLYAEMFNLQAEGYH